MSCAQLTDFWSQQLSSLLGKSRERVIAAAACLAANGLDELEVCHFHVLACFAFLCQSCLLQDLADIVPDRLDAIPGSEAEFAIIKRACRLVAASAAATPAPVLQLSARVSTVPAVAPMVPSSAYSGSGVHTSVAIAKLRSAKRSSAKSLPGAGLGPRMGAFEASSAFFGGTLDLVAWRRRACLR